MATAVAARRVTRRQAVRQPVMHQPTTGMQGHMARELEGSVDAGVSQIQVLKRQKSPILAKKQQVPEAQPQMGINQARPIAVGAGWFDSLKQEAKKIFIMRWIREYKTYLSCSRAGTCTKEQRVAGLKARNNLIGVGVIVITSAGLMIGGIYKNYWRNSEKENKPGSIFEAVKGKNIEAVKNFIQKGANIDEVNKWGYTPLFIAADAGYLEIVKFLADQGANVDAADEGGVTALQRAVDGGYLEITKYLVGKGANVNAVEVDSGLTALHLAADNDNLEIAKFLLEKGADKNIKDINEKTPLDWAETEEMKELLKNGSVKN